MKDQIENAESIRDWINVNYPDSRVDYGTSMIVFREHNRIFTLKIFRNSIFLENGGLKVFKCENQNHIMILDFIKKQEDKKQKLLLKLKKIENKYSDISNNPQLIKSVNRNFKINEIIKK